MYSRSSSFHLGFAPRPFADHNPTNPLVCQRFMVALTREALHNLLKLSQTLLTQGKSTEQILEAIVPS